MAVGPSRLFESDNIHLLSGVAELFFGEPARRAALYNQGYRHRPALHATRAEARRRQQQLEGQQAAGSGPVRHLIIKDNLDRVVI